MARRLTRGGGVVVPLWCLLLASVITGPLLVRRGFALVGDMVFVPRQPWKARWLGVDGSVPRAVPVDAVVSVLSHVVAGDLLQKGVLLGLLAAGGWGVARLVRRHGRWAQLAAVSLFVWNPYVAERLAIGHWALLCGYAALPWVATAAEGVREARLNGYPALVLATAAAAVTSPTGGVLAGLVAVCVVAAGRRVRRVAATVGVALVCNLPWLLPGALVSGAAPTARAGVEGFAARPDTPLGTLGSLLSLGGIWKSTVVPVEREVPALALLGLAVVLVGLVGAGLAIRSGDRTMTGLAIAAGVGLALAWLPATRIGVPVFTWWAAVVPGGGLLRDSQKWVAPLALLVAAGVAALVGRARSRGASGAPVPGLTALLTTAVLLPVAVLPGLAWGELGRLRPAQYPSEWDQVAGIMSTEVRPEDRVVVLPFEIYRRFGWNHERAVLDPAPRYFPGDVITNDLLRLGGGRVVAGEDPVARRLSGPLHTGVGVRAALARADVGWVLLEKGTPGAAGAPVVEGSVLHDGPFLRLTRVGPHGGAPPAPGWRGAVLAVDGILAVGLLGVFGLMVVRRLRGIVETKESRAEQP